MTSWRRAPGPFGCWPISATSTVTTDGDQEVGLTGDDALLRQMIGNLLDNAIRHADSKGRVTASLERSADRVTLRITNDGPPIAVADQERIFERFVRMGASDGAGLGLPIARWIAEAHGGTLQLQESQARLHDVCRDPACRFCHQSFICRLTQSIARCGFPPFFLSILACSRRGLVCDGRPAGRDRRGGGHPGRHRRERALRCPDAEPASRVYGLTMACRVRRRSRSRCGTTPPFRSA